jgi:hypothetical protein
MVPMKTKEDKDRRKNFMAETAKFFEKMEKHQHKPSNKNTKKYPYGGNR